MIQTVPQRGAADPSAATKERLLDAAEKLFAKKGFLTVSIDYRLTAGCAPATSECAQGIDIPLTFIIHLQYTRYGMKTVGADKYGKLPAKASDCIECGLCEERCPYDLPIRARLKEIAQEMG